MQLSRPARLLSSPPARTLVALALTVTFVGFGALLLVRAHPAEDAFILFKYARVLVSSGEISFYVGGPRSEGATDFLWFLAIALAHFFGAQPAWAALGLGGLGFFVIARVFVDLAANARGAPQVAVWLIAMTLATMPFAIAGLMGFSATLYAALCLLLYRAYVHQEAPRSSEHAWPFRGHAAWHVPLLATAIALMRPDGAILAAGFGLLQVLDLRRTARGREARGIVAGWLIAACVGLAYFAFRRSYFGLWLPLPLIVKQHYRPPAPGWEDLLDWLASTALPLVASMGFARWAFGPLGWPRRVALGVLPFVLHLLAFVNVTPTQNVANRFEAPSEIVLTYLAAWAMARGVASADRTPSTARGRRAWLAPVVVVLAMLPRWQAGLPSVLNELHEHHYASTFAPELGRLANARPPTVPRMRLATTEAGRLAYYLDGPTLDLVGLCAPETALRPPTFDLLDRFDPDLVVVHPAGNLDEAAIDHGAKSAFLPIGQSLVALMWPHVRERAVSEPPPYPKVSWWGTPPPGAIDHVGGAPPPVLAWLDAHRDAYAVYAVGIPARYARYHIVAVRRAMPEFEAVVSLLGRAARQEAPGGAP